MKVDIAKLRELASKATPGPWQWFGNTKMTEVYLATVDRGRTFVMDFVRWGMSMAQPRFQVRTDRLGVMVKLQDLIGGNAPKMVAEHRKEFVGIGHPDAEWIAAADPTTVLAILSTLDRAKQLAREAVGMAKDALGTADIWISMRLLSPTADAHARVARENINDGLVRLAAISKELDQ